MIGQISVKNGCKIVDSVSLHGHVQHNVADTNMYAKIYLLLHYGFAPLLDMWERAVAVDQVVVDLADDYFLPPRVLD